MIKIKVQAIWALIIWSLVMIGLCVVFFTGGGPDAFLDGDSRVTLTRVFFTIGFISYFIVLFLTRKRSKKHPIIMDERDELIVKQALMIGFYVLLLYVFFLSIFLYWYYKIHLGIKVMPVGWIWFFGISSFFMGYISQSIATLILYRRMSGDAGRQDTE